MEETMMMEVTAMQTYAIRRKNAWGSPDELEQIHHRTATAWYRLDETTP